MRTVRSELAAESGVPAFVVFSDTTLVDMCRKVPKSKEEMLGVSGVGEVKFNRYGKRFLEVTCKVLNQQNITSQT